MSDDNDSMPGPPRTRGPTAGRGYQRRGKAQRPTTLTLSAEAADALELLSEGRGLSKAAVAGLAILQMHHEGVVQPLGPTTRGALLELARKVWDDPYLHVWPSIDGRNPDGTDRIGWEVCGIFKRPDADGIRGSRIYAKTWSEVEALVAALEAARTLNTTERLISEP